MTYSITFASKTGNTKQLAEAIHHTLSAKTCTYFGQPDKAATDADFVFVGFWTDKGTCSADIASFLEGLANKRVFLFGTAGFGGDETYFQQILQRVAQNLHDTNTIIGSFMCQGKMPESVRARYETLAKTNPEKATPLLANWKKAQVHPTYDDLLCLQETVTAFAKKEF